MILQTAYKKKLREGDVFSIKYGDSLFLFGRIIKVDFEFAGFPGGNLVYVYSNVSKSQDNIPNLLTSNLLIAPEVINRLGFSKGYLSVVENIPLANNDVLGRHCFRSVRGKYFNEKSEEVPFTEPCGEYGLGNYLMLDHSIRKVFDQTI